ncbi:hypothetical protein SLA2020_183220 [Shorea laevis]
MGRSLSLSHLRNHHCRRQTQAQDDIHQASQIGDPTDQAQCTRAHAVVVQPGLGLVLRHFPAVHPVPIQSVSNSRNGNHAIQFRQVTRSKIHIGFFNVLNAETSSPTNGVDAVLASSS